MTALSLRRLWMFYKRTAIAQGDSARDLALAHVVFHIGAQGVLKVLAHAIDHSDHAAVHKMIKRQGRTSTAIQARRPHGRVN